MKNALFLILVLMCSGFAQTLFEVKDASNNKVLDVSSDGLRVFNMGDTLMVISSSAIQAYIDGSKGLSRSFSVSTTTSKNKALSKAFEISGDLTKIGTPKTIMDDYANFSTLNLFLGLNSGMNTVPNPNPFNPGDQTTWEGKFNIFIGNESGKANSNGYFNLFVGDKAGQTNTTGPKNTFIGSQSGQANSEGGYNTFLGYNSGITSTGDYNTVVGADCGFNIQANSGNTMMGAYAGEYFTGNGNTFIGYKAGQNYATLRTGDGNVFIGSYAGYASGSVSNKLYISNTNTNTPLIYGDFTTNNVGLGTNAPGTNRLKVINNASGIAGSTGYFENSNATGIGLAVFTTSTDAALYAEQKNSTSTTANIAKFASAYGGWSEKVVFRSTGSVLMPYLATGTGTDLYITSGGEVVKYSSSKKYKKDMSPLSVDMTRFMKLQPVYFRWNEKSASENKADYGLIAEEVEKIDKELAVYNQDGVVEGVDYQKINIMLLKVVQDQQNRIEGLEKRLERLEAEK